MRWPCVLVISQGKALNPVAIGAFRPNRIMFQTYDVAHLIEELFFLSGDGSGPKAGFMNPAFIPPRSREQAWIRPENPAKKGGIFRPNTR